MSETWDDKGWGKYGDKPACKHVKALRVFMKKQGLDVWSEHGDDPPGWVNLGCVTCHRTYELVLSDRNKEDEDD